LSTRVREALAARRPAILSDDALVFPNLSGGFLLDVYFRNKVFYPAVRKAFGPGLHFSPHCLRHTWASLHMARGTPLKWIQEQGGWTTAKLLLDTYGHFMPTESRGFADALTAQNAPPAHPRPIVAPARLAKTAAKAGGYAPRTTPRSPIMHFTDPPPFLRNSETSMVSGVGPRSRT
jgi:hypothetical protein